MAFVEKRFQVRTNRIRSYHLVMLQQVFVLIVFSHMLLKVTNDIFFVFLSISKVFFHYFYRLAAYVNLKSNTTFDFLINCFHLQNVHHSVWLLDEINMHESHHLMFFSFCFVQNGGNECCKYTTSKYSRLFSALYLKQPKCNRICMLCVRRVQNLSLMKLIYNCKT